MAMYKKSQPPRVKCQQMSITSKTAEDNNNWIIFSIHFLEYDRKLFCRKELLSLNFSKLDRGEEESHGVGRHHACCCKTGKIFNQTRKHGFFLLCGSQNSKEKF